MTDTPTDKDLTPVSQLTQMISQILDDHAGQLHDVNLQSAAGRQFIGEIIARQMVDDPNMVVIDTVNNPQTWFDSSITNLN
jgi:hypothetical protein